MKRLFPVICLFSLIAVHSFAGSATWNLNPPDGRWNNTENWTPATVPNGPADTATFASSTLTDVSMRTDVEVAGIVFDPGAGAFTFSNLAGRVFTISGAGVTNNSGVLQNFVNLEDLTQGAKLYFTNNATAGDSILYTNQPPINRGAESPLIQFEGSSSAGSAQFDNLPGNLGPPGVIELHDNSTAANGTFRNTGFGGTQGPMINFRDQASAGQAVFVTDMDSFGAIDFWDSSTADHATITNAAGSGNVVFYNDSTAADATIVNEGGDSVNEFSATFFEDDSSAGNGTFIANGSPNVNGENAIVQFDFRSKAGTGTFIANGAEVAGDSASGGVIDVRSDSTADHGTFYANGGIVSGAIGGMIKLDNSASAGNGTFYANGATVDGAFGGGIFFEDNSTGDEARIEVFGNGFLDLRNHFTPGLTIGSLEGDGLVFLGTANLSVGSNNLSTKFAGVIQDNGTGTGGKLTKIGTGSLTLSGANTHTGRTTIEDGKLAVNNRTGSATGTGPIQVNAGRLAGRGIIAGAVVVGSGSGPGAMLAPGQGNSGPNTLTIQSTLTFNSDGTYKCGVDSENGRSNKIIANGVIVNSGRFTLRDVLGLSLTPGTVLTVIDNTSANPISGTFANLADGSTVTVGVNKLQVSYEGGDGNDLTLTVVP